MKTLYLFGSGASYAENRNMPIGRDTLGKIMSIQQETLDLNAGSYNPKIQDLTQFVMSCNGKDENDYERLYDWLEPHITCRDWLSTCLSRNRRIGQRNRLRAARCINRSYYFFKSMHNWFLEQMGLHPCPCSTIFPSSEIGDEVTGEQAAILVGLRYLLLSSNKCKLILHRKFFTYIFDEENDVIATTNLDILLDRAIWKEFGRINYGTPRIIRNNNVRKFRFSDKGPLLLKLHGSLSWFQSDWTGIFPPNSFRDIDKHAVHLKSVAKKRDCILTSFANEASLKAQLASNSLPIPKEDVLGRILRLEEGQKTEVDLAGQSYIFEMNFGKLNLSAHNSAQKNVLVEAYDRITKRSQRDKISVIMPGTDKEANIMKNPVIREVWVRFEKELNACDRIVVIGSSAMRDKTNDTHLKKLLTRYKSKIVQTVSCFELYVNSR